MNNDLWDFYQISDQYLDYLNIEYLKLDKAKRLKKLTNYAKRIAEFRRDEDYCQINEIVETAAKEYNCPVEDISLSLTEYPEEITW